MNKILGIDTGGTYTDSVIISADTKEILYQSKTLTTQEQLKKCIEACFERIPEKWVSEISMVCLSTTLATNAIVENRGCKVGLILIGKKPPGKLPSACITLIRGEYDIKGRLKKNLNPEEIHKAVEFFRGKVEAIAISGYASVRNPAHELMLKKQLNKI